jgi:hypothetical protein
MRATDLDWREMFRGWDRADVLFVRSVADEVLAEGQRRRIVIRRDDGKR